MNVWHGYTIEELIGKGSFASVYRANHLDSGETRVIKRIHTQGTSEREKEIALREFHILQSVTSS